MLHGGKSGRSPMHVVIHNLPADAQEAAVREWLARYVKVESISLRPDHGMTMAVVSLPASHVSALLLAEQLQGRSFKGHVLEAWAPMRMPWKPVDQ
jgi:hypothetical protein